MNTRRYILVASILVLGFVLSIYQLNSIAADAAELATSKAVSQLSNQPGRAIVSARGNHFIVDSVPPLAGPNEELNPLDMLLGALGTCGTFVFEKAAQESGVPLSDIAATVQADFDPRGVKGEPVDPRMQAIRIHLDVANSEGSPPATEQIEALKEAFQTRCPIFTTLSRAVSIEITVNDEAMSGPIAEGLATATASVQLSNQPGRAIVSARGNHFVIDSVPPLAGPNEERNPLDLLLGALATCGTFVYERAAQELNIPLTAIVATVEGDFDPSGVKGEPVDPRIQAFRLHIEVSGADQSQADKLAEALKARCPIFTTLSRSAPIELTTSLK